MRNIYLASSWRNPHQPRVVGLLRSDGHVVYDFRHPGPGDDGFAWSDIDSTWQEWAPIRFRRALTHPLAEAGFRSDFGAMERADTCVLLLPCGRSAHLEAGYFCGAGKEVFIVLDALNEPELMYKMATHICVDISELREKLSIATEANLNGMAEVR